MNNFGYDKILTFEDIMRIRKTFLTGIFAEVNCELFGWKEDKLEDYRYFDKFGIEITDPKKLKRRIAAERRSQLAGHRSFSGISESILSREYFDVLDDRGIMI